MRLPVEIPGIDDRYLMTHGPFDSLRALGRHIGLQDALVGGVVSGSYVDYVLGWIGGVLSRAERATFVLGLMEGVLDAEIGMVH